MSALRRVVEVPASTALADLDDALGRLLRGQLAHQGLEGVDVAFDTPSREWAAKLTRPTVNVFLCDLRRSKEEVEHGFRQARQDGRAVERPAALRMDCWYAISAWAPEVLDEHRLLSQVVSVLHSHPILTPEVLGPRLSDGSQRFAILTRLGDDREEKRADFWQSVGGHYKPAVDYVVTIAFESGVAIERGPDVRQATVRTRSLDRPGRVATEMHHLGGRVLGADGRPAADSWVSLPSLGRMAVTDSRGRFRVGPLPAGEHECRARDRAGREASARASVPGGPVDLRLDAGSGG